MYGAVLGDIIGSPYEYDKGEKIKEFELFPPNCMFTDDTVMTVAVAQALLEAGIDSPGEKIRGELIKTMQRWGRQYICAGYGINFLQWILSEDPKPYGSCGNGSAMRVSAAAWLCDSLEQVKKIAKYTAEISHNHPEGIKGAQAVASCIYMARTGRRKNDIKDFIEFEYAYDLSKKLDDIRPTYHHIETCQSTVPEAIIAFLEATGFEDAVRNAVSLGGDTDTTGAIAGSIAEAYYGIPHNLLKECKKRLPKEFIKILNQYD